MTPLDRALSLVAASVFAVSAEDFRWLASPEGVAALDAAGVTLPFWHRVRMRMIIPERNPE